MHRFKEWLDTHKTAEDALIVFGGEEDNLCAIIEENTKVKVEKAAAVTALQWKEILRVFLLMKELMQQFERAKAEKSPKEQGLRLTRIRASLGYSSGSLSAVGISEEAQKERLRFEQAIFDAFDDGKTNMAGWTRRARCCVGFCARNSPRHQSLERAHVSRRVRDVLATRYISRAPHPPHAYRTGARF